MENELLCLILIISNLIKVKSQSEVPGKRSDHILKKFMKTLGKLKGSSAVSFNENFPFYVILAVRMYR